MKECNLKIECPVCRVRAFEECFIRPNEPYTIKYGPMIHVARVADRKEATDVPD